MQQPYRTIIDAVEMPRIIQLGPNLYGAAFFVMKLLPARFILDKAEEAGLVRPGSTVIETTSGTFGLALAMLCNQRGYRLILVNDPAIDAPLQRRLESLGTTVEIVREPAAVGGYQQARLDRLEALRRANPGHFWPLQYDNPHNPGAYAALAELLTETLGQIDCLVGTVGSGGSVCGTGAFLRTLFPQMQVVGVDTHGSVLFGHPDRKRLLRGLGNSLMPKNVDHRIFDEVHWINAAEGFEATRELHRRHALYMGPTSGSAYLVARWWAERNPQATVVALFPDEGYRYQDTVYDDAWLDEQQVRLAALPAGPRQIAHPAEAGDDWAYMHWRRRAYADVVTSGLQSAEAR